MGEEQDLSLDDISPALLGIEQLILVLDYAMWLCIAYDGKPDDARVSLVQGPEQERSAAIDAYLRDHRDELRVKSLQCPTCGKVVLETSETRCNTCRVALEPELASDEDLRGRAWDRLIWTVPGTQARYIIPIRLVQRLSPGQTLSGEHQLPKKTVVCRLVKFVRLVKDKDIGNCWKHLHIASPSMLVPHGANLQERHRSYLVTRERLVAGYNWLTGIARRYPGFMDDHEQHKGIRRFPPALTMTLAKAETPTAAGDTATGHQAAGDAIQIPPAPQSLAELPVWIQAARELLRGQEDQPIEETGIAYAVRKHFLEHLERLYPVEWPAWHQTFQPQKFQAVRDLVAMMAWVGQRISGKRPASTIVEGFASKPAEPAAEPERNVYLSPADIAETYKVPLNALRKRLEHWRKSHGDGWKEVKDRKPREPRYLYQVSAIWSMIQDLRKETSETTSERPAK